MNQEQDEKIEALGNAIGDFLGEFFSAIVILGVTGGILFFCWNYGLHQVAPVSNIKYFECFLLILGWRALTYQRK